MIDQEPLDEKKQHQEGETEGGEGEGERERELSREEHEAMWETVRTSLL